MAVHPLSHRGSHVARVAPPSRARRSGAAASAASGTAAMLVAGLGLTASVLGLGELVTATGATGTGELALDVTLSHHRDALVAVPAHLVDVALDPLVAPVWVLLIALVLWLANRRAALAFVVVTGTEWGLAEVTELIVARPRPPMAAVQALAVERGLTSFPSGHTAFAAGLVAGAVVAAGVMGRSARWIWIAGVPFVAFVAYTRLILGVHYLADVLASPMLVAGSTLVIVGTAQWWESRRPGAKAP